MVNLSRHLQIKKHSWCKGKAAASHLNFNLNEPRKTLSPSKRRSRIKILGRWICPIYHCFKEVKRLPNHLRQYHILTGAEVNRYANLAVKTIDSLIFDEHNEVHDSTEEEEEKLYEKHFSNHKGVRKTDFDYDSDSSDCDWLAHQYHKRQVGYRKLISLDDLSKDFDDEGSHIDDLSKNDFDDVNVEGEYPDKFFVSSFNEDVLMDDFVNWLQTIDGDKKSLR